MLNNLSTKDFVENLNLLRKYIVLYILIFCLLFAFSFYYIEYIVKVLAYPLLETLNCNNLSCTNLIYTSFEEKFISFMYLAFFVALLLSLPFAFFLICSFIFPALYKREKVFYIIIALLFLLSFYTGVYLCYKYFLVKIWSFFINFASQGEDFYSFLPKMQEYFAFTKKMLLIAGLVFEMPFILILLGFLGLIKPKQLRSLRKYVIFALFVFSAIITPPDPFSQIILALFLIICYEIAIYVIIILNRLK